MIRGRKGEYRKEFADLQKRGFQRVKVDGKFYEIADAPALDKKIKHDIDVVVDRIVVRADIAARLADSFETALELADGIAIVEFADAPKAANAHPPSRRADGAPQDEASPHPSLSKERGSLRGPQSRKKIPNPSASPSRSASPALSPASPSTRSSRGYSRSTTRSARARNAMASARS